MRFRQLVSTCATPALAMCMAGCSPPPQQAAPPNDAFVYVIGRGWHTDIGLPSAEIAGPLASLKGAFPGVQVLAFGFGERQFLVNRQKTFGSMLNALLPSESALLVTALRTSPQEAFGAPNVVVLPVTRAGLAQIEASIWQEFDLNPAGDALPLAEGPYSGSVFYPARQTYDGLYTCNTWTANVLRAGGQPMPATVLFAGQVMGMARWISAH